MKRSKFFKYIPLMMCIPALCNAGVLSSEWETSPNDLMRSATRELDKKSLDCVKNCAITANYRVFSKTMKARFWFTTNDKNDGQLKEIWLDSKKFEKSGSLKKTSSQLTLFNKFKKLYTAKYGQPKKEYRDNTMKFLGISTYVWQDSKRNNLIHLENWLDQVRLKYKPLSKSRKTL